MRRISLLVSGAVAGLLLQAVTAHSQQVTFAQTSDPAGIVNQSALYSVGATVTTVNAAMESGAYRFTHWTIAGVRTNDYLGCAVNPVRTAIYVDTAAIANYTNSAADSDADGVGDWYELYHFGTLAKSGAYDGDGDGYSLAEEYRRDFQPLIKDRLVAGGLSRRQSTQIVVRVTAMEYAFTSDPAGLVNQTGLVATGTVVQTQNLQGANGTNTFGYWTVLGVRQADWMGRAVSLLKFTVSNDVAAVAQYFGTATDTDTDGLPDWWEWLDFGNLAFDGTNDADGDGYTLLEEYRRDFEPLIKDRLVAGGLSRRQSAQISYIRPTMQLTVNSVYGGPVPAVGMQLYDWAATVTCRITNSPVPAGLTQYMCLGWTGTGSVPSTGTTTNTGPIILRTNSTVTWLWATNYWLDTLSAPNGSVDTGDGWYFLGSNVTVTAIPAAHYHFAGWTGNVQGNTNALAMTLTMDQPRAVTANFAIDKHTLTVTSAHGGVNPGTTTVDYNTPLGQYVVNSPVFGGVGTQYVCTAGVVAGNDGTQVSATNITVTLTNDATLTWQWQTQYWLTALTNGNGGVTAADGWYDSGSNAVLTASAAEHWHFTGWSGDTNGCGLAGNVITAALTQARSIVANFAIDQHTLTVVSAQGGANPGTTTVDYNTALDQYVINSPVSGGVGTQYVCTAGVVAGNDATQIAPTNVTLTLTNDATLTWSWQTQYLLTALTNGNGGVTAADGWYDSGSNAVLTASAAAHWHFTGWSGDTQDCAIVGNVITAAMTQARSIVANFVIDQHTLTVVSAQGGANPGTTTVDYNTALDQYVINSPVFGGVGTQYVCTAGVVAGNDATQVSPTNVTLTLTNDATLTWQWKTQYLATATAGANGTVTPTNALWVDAGGSTVSYTASPDAAYFVDQWYVNGVSVQTGGTDFTATGIAGATAVLVTFQQQVATPTFSPDGGSFPDSLNVTIQCATPGATIHYTTDGNDPTAGDPTVASGDAVLIASTSVLKAKAWNIGWLESTVKSASYTILEPRVSIISPTNGAFLNSRTVKITVRASDSDGLGEVSLYSGTNLIVTTNLSSGPVSWSNDFQWTGMTNGVHSLTALAVDGLGNTTTSLVVTVWINHSTLANLYWQLAAGQTYCWLMNTNGTQKSSLYIYSNSTPWVVKAAGDIDGDGIADLVWQLPTGQVAWWQMNTNGMAKSSAFILNTPTTWLVRGAGDLDGDGIADLVWQLPTGQVYCWFMNSDGTQKAGTYLSSAASLWQIRAVGDINGDGIADLVWQLPTGQTVCWFMNADGTRRWSSYILATATAWQVRAAGDIDGDGIADLIWQLPTGQAACWLMNPSGTAKSVFHIYTGPTAWQVRCAGW